MIRIGTKSDKFLSRWALRLHLAEWFFFFITLDNDVWTLRVAQFYRAIARYSNCTDVFFPKKRGWLDYVFLRHHCFALIQHLDRGVATLAFLPDRSETFGFGPFLGMWFVRMRHSSHRFASNSCHSVDLAGWQAKMASIEFWIP